MRLMLQFHTQMMIKYRSAGRILGGALALTMLFAAAGPSSALIPPNEEAFTLNASVGPIAYTGGSVTLDPIPGSELLNGIASGPNIGINCLDGVCDIKNQDWVVFRVSVVSGNVSELGLTLLDSFASGLNSLGMGYFLEDGPIQDGSGSTASYAGSIGDPDLPLFTFLANGGGGITTGSNFGGSTLSDTSLALFVAFADGTLPHTPTNFGVFGDGAVSFMVEPFGGAGAGSSQGNFATSLEVIPEPGTALLMGLGLALLGARRKGRSTVA